MSFSSVRPVWPIFLMKQCQPIPCISVTLFQLSAALYPICDWKAHILYATRRHILSTEHTYFTEHKSHIPPKATNFHRFLFCSLSSTSCSSTGAQFLDCKSGSAQQCTFRIAQIPAEMYPTNMFSVYYVSPYIVCAELKLPHSLCQWTWIDTIHWTLSTHPEKFTEFSRLFLYILFIIHSSARRNRIQCQHTKTHTQSHGHTDTNTRTNHTGYLKFA